MIQDKVAAMPAPEARRPLSAYVAVGAEIANFALDPEAATLERRGTLRLPSRVQYAWPHPALPILYAACADRTAGAAGQPFYLCALARDAAGDLALLDDPVTLPSRPIHVTTDEAGGHVLTAYGTQPGLTIHKLDEAGRIGAELPRADGFDMGTSPHQVRVIPGTAHAILVARGRKGFGTPGYVRGALKILRFDRGAIENVATICPGEGSSPGGFNPRHLDVHADLILVSLEEQNRLCVFRREGPEVAPLPVFSATTLRDPEGVQERQDCGTVHVHPNGRVAYVANRNDGYRGGHKGPSWLTPDPIPVFPGGENNIAAFALEGDGTARLIQTEDTRGLHPRTFALDPAGRILVAGNLAPTLMPEGGGLVAVPASLALFRVGEDGRLAYLARHEIDVKGEMVWWMGIVA